jgi:hypothetical protein
MKEHDQLHEEDAVVCQNPRCQDSIKDGDFCCDCEEHLSLCEKWNIRYAMEHGIESRHVLAHIMNGGSWNQ